MVVDDWKSSGTELVGRMAAEVSASLTANSLTENLIEFTLHPANSDATDIKLIISPSEVIVSAGLAMQIELPPLSQSEARLISIVRAIASGNLNESARGGLVRYQLLLSDGDTIEGRSMRGIPLGRRQTTSYSAYSVA